MGTNRSTLEARLGGHQAYRSNLKRKMMDMVDDLARVEQQIKKLEAKLKKEE